MTRRFTVHIDLPDTLRTYYLDVVVHDTDAEMVRLARRKHGPGMPDDIGGCVHSDFTNPRRVGLMRLSAEHLNGSFIIHESVHAGVTLATKDYDCDPLRLKRSGGNREELVAYASHNFATAILNHLLDLDLREEAEKVPA